MIPDMFAAFHCGWLPWWLEELIRTLSQTFDYVRLGVEIIP